MSVAMLVRWADFSRSSTMFKKADFGCANWEEGIAIEGVAVLEFLNAAGMGVPQNSTGK